MKPLHIETPFFESHPLSLQAGRAVWLKLEALQPPGSFKIRGIGLACQEYARRGPHRFISSSGGNAGIAVAYAGRHLAIPVVVVVPETATERARQLIQQEGAEVMVHGASWQEAHTNTAEGMWTTVRNFLRPFRGVHKKYLSGYVAMCEFSINLKRISPSFISLLVTRTCA
jgi:L-serine/L-threonine ammonia-lyase